MKINQKFILKIASIIIGLMLIYPPYNIRGRGSYGGSIVETGYAFIFDLPERASIDGVSLLVQWVGVCLIAVLLYKFFENREDIDLPHLSDKGITIKRIIFFFVGWLLGVVIVDILRDMYGTYRMPAIGNLFGMILGYVGWKLAGKKDKSPME